MTFYYLPPNLPALVAFRQEEALESKIPGPEVPTWRRVRALCQWLDRECPTQDGSSPPSWDASEILKAVREKRDNYVICGQRAILFLQAAISLGIQARYIERGRKGNPYCHFLVEVFYPEAGKWFLVDTLGVTLSDGRWHARQSRKSALDAHRIGERDYYYFRIFFTQDLTGQVDFDAVRWEDAIEWEGLGMVMWEDSVLADDPSYAHRRLTLRRTSDPADLYWEPTTGYGLQATGYSNTHPCSLSARSP